MWPHDTALCAAGLARYGFRQDAARVAEGLLDAAAAYEHRLPELFAGFDRAQVPVPVPYAAACSPQAWASAAPLELLTALLSLRPDATGLRVSPELPARLAPLVLERIEVRGRRWNVEVDADGRSATVTPAGR